MLGGFGLVVAFGLPGTIVGGATVPAATDSLLLPYDRTCPVVYDNDGAIESGYTDVYIMALASARAIRLKGIITTCSYGEEHRNPAHSPMVPTEVARERQELVEKARRSGMSHLPDVTAGCSLSLRRPASDDIESTVPFRSPGSRLIIREARKATRAQPLVIVMGGQATTVVDAYLQDPAIADRMVLAWIVGNKRADGGIDSNEYNLGVDPWASYIAFERLRVVAFPFTNDGNDANDAVALTPKSRLGELPDTELRQTMKEAAWPRGGGTNSEPAADYDAMGAFPLTRPDYVRRTAQVSFSRWEPSQWNANVQVPLYRRDPKGRALVVWEGDAKVATEEWWRRVKDPAAWGRQAGHVPFGGTPWPVPGKIEAEDFDHGGEGRAYHSVRNNFTKEEWLNPIRVLEHMGIVASPTASGRHAVGRTDADEWMAYSVKAASAGTYSIGVRVACAGAGGTFHVEADGADRTGSMAVPDTGGPDAWQVVSRDGVVLSAGRHVLRLVMDRTGPGGTVGTFDCITIARSGQAGRCAAARPFAAPRGTAPVGNPE